MAEWKVGWRTEEVVKKMERGNEMRDKECGAEWTDDNGEGRRNETKEIKRAGRRENNGGPNWLRGTE